MSGKNWTLEGEHDWSDCSVSFDGDGYHYTIYEPGRALPVAFVIGDTESWRDEEGDDVRKRALTMAAAPDLLEALQRLVTINAEYVEFCEPGSAYDQARIAIARATGDA